MFAIRTCCSATTSRNPRLDRDRGWPRVPPSKTTIENPDEKNEQFVRLLTQHEGDLHRYVVSLVFDVSAVDDIMQEVAVALWKKFGEFDPERPFLPWACRFAYFQVLKHRSKIGRSRLVFGDDLVELLAADYENESEIMGARRKALDTCLDKLPRGDQELIQLRYGSTRTVRELAEQRRMSVHKLYHALERIRGWLMDCTFRTLKKEGYEELA